MERKTNQTALKRFPSLLLSAIVCLAAGCAMTPGKGTFAGPREPGIIAIRNTTGRQAESMTIEEEKTGQGASMRMGAMAPVAAITPIRSCAAPMRRRCRRKCA